MKKLICLLLAAMLLSLTACADVSVNAPSDSDKVSDAATDATADEVPEEQEMTEDEAAPEEEEAGPAFPKYKLVTEYYHEMYEGTAKEDGEGNSLENKSVFEGMSEVIMLAEESKDDFPELYKSLNDAAKEEKGAADANAKGLTEEATKDAESSKEDGRPFYGPFTNYSRIFVMRSDDKILSFCMDYSNFYGGAHGMYGRSGVTYDVATGKKLELTDVVDTTEEKLIPVLKEKILASTEDPNGELDDLDEKLAGYKLSVDEPFNEETQTFEFGYDWYLSPEGVHFYFGPYEIASYAFGATDVVIGYDEFPGSVKEEYIPDPDKGYIVYGDIPVTGSSWDDEKNDTLHFVYETSDEEYNENDSYDCTALTLRRGSKSATAEDEYFSYSYDKDYVKQYKVVTGDGRQYIYVCALSFNDYTDVMVFDITGDDVKLCGVHTCHMVYADTDTDYAGEFILNNPDSMYFAEVGDLMGTYTCYGRYVVGADGMPEFVDKDYKVSWRSEDVKSKKEIKVTILDADRNETEEATIPAGTHFVPEWTDNSTYMDCSLGDGRLVRIKYSKTGYPAEIDGESVDDLFDGLMYAG